MSYLHTLTAIAVVAGSCSLVNPAVAVADECHVDLGSPVVQAALDAQPEALPGVPWSHDPASFEGNFNPCATLSVAIATVQGATGSSPNVALMFHRGRFLGPATATPRGFTSVDGPRTSDDTVVLDYKTPGSCNACDDGSITPVRFQWREGGNGHHGRVVALDPLPPL